MTGTKKTLLGCGGLIGLFCILTCGGLLWLASGPESGVKLANEMEPSEIQYLKDHHILAPSEEVVAYFDSTLFMDGSESSILTNQRIISHKQDVNTAMDLTAIEDIKHRKETLAGDIFEIYGKGGRSMKIEIAPMNGGETFEYALMNAWDRAKAEGKSESEPAAEDSTEPALEAHAEIPAATRAQASPETPSKTSAEASH